jgi:hypothetical protein
VRICLPNWLGFHHTCWSGMFLSWSRVIICCFFSIGSQCLVSLYLLACLEIFFINIWAYKILTVFKRDSGEFNYH